MINISKLGAAILRMFAIAVAKNEELLVDMLRTGAVFARELDMNPNEKADMTIFAGVAAFGLDMAENPERCHECVNKEFLSILTSRCIQYLEFSLTLEFGSRETAVNVIKTMQFAYPN